MNGLSTEQKRRRRTILYIYILIALLALLVVASYTWLSISRTPRVSDMALFISAGKGLELAPSHDAADEDWGQLLDFADLVSETAPLRPITWSQERQSFLSIDYGFDGRMTDRFDVLTDEANANRADDQGYYAVATFYARTDKNCSVSLAEAVEVNEGKNGAGTYVIGTPVWDNQNILHNNGGNGAETAVRLGFLISRVNTSTGEAQEGSFYIYEPNCDKHISGDGYVQTPSIDGTPQLSDNLILQSASSWEEAYPVERNVTIKTLGSFTTDTKLFGINAGEIYQIKLYVWLEGQDADCINKIGEAQIAANVQFDIDYSGQSGMEEITEN